MSLNAKFKADKKEFRALLVKLKVIYNLADKEINLITKIFNSTEKESLVDRDKLESISSANNLEPSVLEDLVPVLLSLHATSSLREVTIEELFDDLNDGIMSEEEQQRTISFYNSIEDKINELWDHIDSKIAPWFPVPRYKDFNSIVVKLSDFDKDFTNETILKDYNPKIKRFHDRVLITITSSSEKKDKDFNFLASKGDLENLILSFQLTLKKLKIASDS